MKDYSTLYIILIAFLLAFLLSRKFSLSVNKNVNNISAEEAQQLIKSKKDLVIIDVRTTQEFKSGHIPGSKSIPVGEFASRLSELTKYKDRPVLVHCASGGRSPAAVRILLKNNFNNLYHLKHGLREWKFGLK